MRIKHLAACATVLGLLAGLYSRARADYVFAEQTVNMGSLGLLGVLGGYAWRRRRSFA